MENRSFDGEERQHTAVLAKEERNLERARAKRDALETNMTKSLAAVLKAHRKTLSREAAVAVNRSESGNMSANERAIMEAGQRCVDSMTSDTQVIINEGPATGYAEKKMPWLRGSGDDEDY